MFSLVIGNVIMKDTTSVLPSGFMISDRISNSKHPCLSKKNTYSPSKRQKHLHSIKKTKTLTPHQKDKNTYSPSKNKNTQNVYKEEKHLQSSQIDENDKIDDSDNRSFMTIRIINRNPL